MVLTAESTKDYWRAFSVLQCVLFRNSKHWCFLQ